MTSETAPMRINTRVDALPSLLRGVGDGSLRLPQLPKDFAWAPEQILTLLDSIERGWPIGSLLCWEPDEPLPSLDAVGDQAVSAAPAGKTPTYVLDGYHRVTVLYATMCRPAEPHTSGDDGKWWPYRVLGAADDHGPYYRYWTEPTPPPAHWLPVRAMLKTTDFLSATRNLDDAALQAEAGKAAQAILQYDVPTVQLSGGTIEAATTIVERITGGGSPRTSAALAAVFT